MNNVQRFWCHEAQNIRCVRESDYAKLEAEAQALREEVAALKHSQQVLIGSRNAHRDERDAALKEVADLRMARDDFKLERDLARQNFCDEQAANYQLKAHLNTCLDELSALRARVVVLPDASTVYAALDARERLFTSPENIQVALEAQSRLNGMTVSEGLLRKWLELMEHGDYREGHCMCGSPVDSHGIRDGHTPIDAGEYYAGQVMEELRDLLSEQEGGKP
ncbi:hypothetical protein HMPREF1223_12290 [Pseudomonas aeruginosa str. Stone 130]|uniref:hypothetical protein n=1 Tax=Pseudomonas aeruginosa TaxID=287 RepID=UPI0002C8F0D1|nr:hypothetical protein [Pseudomonas aeruginosa]EMZ50106.1 hypothetical protein HMPREF1223_12290 [Pseudomonas aeruginosa str. Stone 130]